MTLFTCYWIMLASFMDTQNTKMASNLSYLVYVVDKEVTRDLLPKFEELVDQNIQINL